MFASSWGPEDTDMEFTVMLKPCSDDPRSSPMLEQLGAVHGPSKHVRKPKHKKKIGKHIVSEMYSPPRITAECNRGGFRKLAPGLALDLPVTNPDSGRPLGVLEGR